MSESVTCVSCFAVNGEFETFCRECGAPIGATATLDPLNTIQSEGFLLRRALKGRPKLLVVVGVWLMFLPVLIFSAAFAFTLIYNHERPSDFVFFWVFVALSVFSFVCLWRVTKNYFKPDEESE